MRDKINTLKRLIAVKTNSISVLQLLKTFLPCRAGSVLPEIVEIALGCIALMRTICELADQAVKYLIKFTRDKRNKLKLNFNM